MGRGYSILKVSDDCAEDRTEPCRSESPPFPATVSSGPSEEKSTYVDGYFKTSHKEKPYGCKQCGKCFSRKAKVKDHILSHTGEKPHTCLTCGKSFSLLGNLTRHSRIHIGEDIPHDSIDDDSKERKISGDQETSCTPNSTLMGLSEETYGMKPFMQAHMKVNMEGKTFECFMCGKSFSRKAKLEDHIRSHTGEKPHVCKVCGKSFSILGNLSRHSRIHKKIPHDSMDQDCEEQKVSSDQETSNISNSAKNLSEETYSMAPFMDSNMKIDTDGKTYDCFMCGKSFSRKAKLEDHIRSHTGEKPHICDICGKSFSILGNLSRHSRIHGGVRTHVCKFCRKLFCSSNDLKRHTRTHTGERPFVCETCNKSFSQKRTLSLHMKTHTGEKTFKCGECGKAFARACTLSVHKRTHTGEKPHICKECGKMFSQTGNLKAHMKLHAAEIYKYVPTTTSDEHARTSRSQISKEFLKKLPTLLYQQLQSDPSEFLKEISALDPFIVSNIEDSDPNSFPTQISVPEQVLAVKEDSVEDPVDCDNSDSPMQNSDTGNPIPMPDPVKPGCSTDLNPNSVAMRISDSGPISVSNHANVESSVETNLNSVVMPIPDDVLSNPDFADHSSDSITNDSSDHSPIVPGSKVLQMPISKVLWKKSIRMTNPDLPQSSVD